MLVNFYSVEQGEEYYFPGREEIGEVIGIFGNHRTRHSVRVLFKSGITTTYTQQGFCARTVDGKQEEQVKAKDGQQVIGLAGKVVPKIRRKWRKPQAVVAPVAPVEIPEVIDERDLPEIPGPPVPKPVAGVWSSMEWSL